MHRISRIFLAFSVLQGLFTFQPPVMAAPGDIDVSFGFGGTVQLDAPSSVMELLTETSSGKIAVLGTWGSVGNYRIDLRRLNSDGMVDQAYGVNGKAVGVKTSPSFGTPVYGVPKGLAVQSDGKTLVVGTLEGSLVSAVWRFTATGILDTTFGTNGRFVIPATSIKQSSTKDIVIDGSRSVISYSEERCNQLNICNWKAYIIRINSNGTLDTTFGSSGRADVTTPNFSGFPKSLVRRSSNGSFYVGSYFPTSGVSASVRRLTNNGNPDVTFGLLGNVNILINCPGGANSGYVRLHSQSDGKPIVSLVTVGIAGGEVVYPSATRLSTSGALDSGFGNSGSICFESQTNPTGVPVTTLQQNNQLVYIFGETAYPKFNRRNLDGTEDTTFVPAFGGIGSSVAVTATSNSKLLVLTKKLDPVAFVVSRFLQN